MKRTIILQCEDLYCQECGHTVTACNGCGKKFKETMGDDDKSSMIADPLAETFCFWKEEKKHYCLDCKKELRTY